MTNAFMNNFSEGAAMREMHATACAFCAAVVLAGCNKPAVEERAPVRLVTTTDTTSYLIGIDIAYSLRDVKDDIILDMVFAGIRDKLAGAEVKIPPEAQRVIMQALQMRMEQKQMAKTDDLAEKNLAEANRFMEENGRKQGVKTTSSGLQYIVVREGTGPVPPEGSKISVNYEMSLASGKVLIRSDDGKPAVWKTDEGIPGLQEACRMMKVGGKYTFFLPPDLAYGRRGFPHDIGPFVVIVYEIELLGIVK
jgi:FKBP-type peptidyl-prolyl cis-trans isomerase FkpA